MWNSCLRYFIFVNFSFVQVFYFFFVSVSHFRFSLLHFFLFVNEFIFRSFCQFLFELTKITLGRIWNKTSEMTTIIHLYTMHQQAGRAEPTLVTKLVVPVCRLQKVKSSYAWWRLEKPRPILSAIVNKTHLKITWTQQSLGIVELNPEKS